MASLKAIRAALRTTITGVVGAGVEVYARIPGQPVLPCVCVVPNDSDFLKAMARGTDTYIFDLVVLAPSGDNDVAQDILDDYVTGAGDKSLRQAIFNNRTLGLSNVDAHVSGMTDYGGSFEAVDVDHIGARLRLVVHTTGTA
jgi:hypothetical protein